MPCVPVSADEPSATKYWTGVPATQAFFSAAKTVSVPAFLRYVKEISISFSAPRYFCQPLSRDGIAACPFLSDTLTLIALEMALHVGEAFVLVFRYR